MASSRRHSSISTFPTAYYNNNERFVYKIITLGNVGVGKSTLISSYVRGSYQENAAPAQLDTKILRIGERLVQLDIWDTAGQERYDSITPNYYRDAHGCLLCFDISEERSVDDLITWHQRFQEKCNNKSAPIILTGMKSDLRQTSQPSEKLRTISDSKLLGRHLDLKYMEVSSRRPETLDRLFDELVNMIEQTYTTRVPRDTTPIVPPKKTGFKRVCSSC